MIDGVMIALMLVHQKNLRKQAGMVSCFRNNFNIPHQVIGFTNFDYRFRESCVIDVVIFADMDELSKESSQQSPSPSIDADKVWLGLGIMLLVLIVGLGLTLLLILHESRAVRTIGALVGVLCVPVTLAFLKQADDNHPHYRGLLVGGLIGIGIAALMVGWCVANYN